VRGARRVAHLVLTPGSSPAALRRFAAWADRRSVYDDASQSLTVLTGPLAGMIRYGPFVTSDLAFARGKYESEIVAFLAEHCGPHDIAFDVGANVGYHTMLLSRLVGSEGRVVAFEPVPTTAAWLEETLRRNDLTNVTVLRTALGASAGVGRMRIGPASEAGLAHLVDSAAGYRSHFTGATRVIDVPITSIDQLLRAEELPMPTVIKIDVEGAELQVLRGASETLATARPTVVTELWGGENVREGRRLLESFGYRVVTLRHWRDLVGGSEVEVENVGATA
jgi:FkbM family methyltransferase